MSGHRDLRGLANDAGLLLARLMIAVVFVFHGAQKLFGLFGGPGLEGTAGFMESLGLPLPLAAAVLAGSAELFGGLAVGAGLLFRPAIVPLVVTMAVACLTAHTGFDATAGGMEYPLTLAVFLTALGLTGPGRFTIPGAIAAGREPERPEEEVERTPAGTSG